MCFRCFGKHIAIDCRKEITCNRCSKGHNSLLHEDTKRCINSNNLKQGQDTLLATAVVLVKCKAGGYNELRALIDGGSQKTLISEEAAQILRIPRIRRTIEFEGISQTTQLSKNSVHLTIKPKIPSSFKTSTEALVLPTLHRALPSKKFDIDINNEWKGYRLADPRFNEPSRIDMVIGVDLFPLIMMEKIKTMNGILGQKNRFGWIVSGNITRAAIISATTTINLKDLERFWELEDEADDTITDNAECERKFQKTTVTNEEGRFVVSIPLNKEAKLGTLANRQ
ncbi:uncharacterized protein LOC123327158 [Drosophila simulans]|uniref:uncharacterized protein LOC123327158 n=1 Tax=Drosophila simulans TaxID=7240 RepID=UPI001D10D98E|nr:uncharacterized protein LOC123327158 [Drosophila simulans]